MPGKKFKFPLDSVLRLRRHDTEVARQSFAQRVQERLHAEETAQQAQQRLQDLAGAASFIGQVIDPRLLRQTDAHRREAQRAHEYARRNLDQMLHQEARARDQLLNRRRDEEALQTLFDEQRQAHLKQMEDTDNAFLDEQAVAGHSRKKQRRSA